MGSTLVNENKGYGTADINWPGLGDVGTFDAYDGGDLDSEVGRYKPARLPEEVTSGTTTITNVTLKRGARRDVDRPLVGPLADANGKADAVIAIQWLDDDDNPYGAPISYTGKLKGVKLPKFDSTSNNQSMIELEFEINGKLSA